jgi:hypothetical protein
MNETGANDGRTVPDGIGRKSLSHKSFGIDRQYLAEQRIGRVARLHTRDKRPRGKEGERQRGIQGSVGELPRQFEQPAELRRIANRFFHRLPPRGGDRRNRSFEDGWHTFQTIRIDPD